MDVYECMRKSQSTRSLNDVKKIFTYLLGLEDFLQMIRNSNIGEKFVKELLRSVASNINIVTEKKEKMLFRYGDIGKMFYIVFSGKAHVLVPKLEKFYMNEEEYVTYLLKLRRNEETELLSMTLAANQNSFLIDLDFEMWMKMQLSPFLVSGNSGNPKKDSNNTNNLNGLNNQKSSVIKQNNLKLSRRNTIWNNTKLINAIRKTFECIDDPENNSSLFYTSVEEYILRTKPDSIITNPTDERKITTVYIYQHMNTLVYGERFGDVALDSKTQKRTATVIVDKDTDFGVIEKIFYEKSLKEVNDRSKRYFISLIFSYEMFKDFSKITFEKRYLNYFKFQKFKRGDKVIIEGQPINNIFFLKSGEFSITTYRSVLDIDGIINVFKDNNTQVTMDDKVIREKKFQDPKFSKAFLTKKSIHVGIIKDRQVLGLHEVLRYVEEVEDYEKNQNVLSFFTITCNSILGETYSLPIDFFNYIYSREKVIRENLSKYYVIRKGFILARLLNYKHTQINLYKNKISEEKIVKEKIEKVPSSGIKLSNGSKFKSEPQLNTTLNRRKNKLPTIKMTQNLNLEDSISKGLSTVNHSQTLNTIHSNNNLSGNPDIKGNNRKEFLDMYKTKIVKKNLFNNLFGTYLNSTPTFKEFEYYNTEIDYLNINIRSQNKKISIIEDSDYNYLYTTKDTSPRNDKSSLKLSLNQNGKNITTSSSFTPRTERQIENDKMAGKVRILDPLVMDNFTKMYSTISSVYIDKPKKKPQMFKPDIEIRKKIIKWKLNKKKSTSTAPIKN